MKPKKYAKADIKKRSILFLQIGLILVLLVSYFTIEWKSYFTQDKPINKSNLVKIEEEEIPITVFVDQTPPPLPDLPKSNEVLKVIDNDKDVKSDIIPPTDELPEIVDVSDIKEAKRDEEVETYSFILIEDVPIFPGCERFTDNEKRKTCMSEKISDFVNSNFDRSIGSDLGLNGINKVYVMFNIDKNGHVVDIKSKASHPKLEEEAIRVIKSLPNFEPGKQRGKPVKVSYSLPIIFQMQD